MSCENDPTRIIHKKLPVLNSSSSFSHIPNHSTSQLLNRKTLCRPTRQETKEYYAIRNLTRIPRMPRRVLFNRSVRYPCILMTNARSITNKLNDFESLLHANHCDVAIVTETWLSECTVTRFNLPFYHHFSVY